MGNCMCGEKLIWGGDHTYEECGHEGEGIVSNLSCPNDKCAVETVFMHQRFDIEEESNKTKTTYIDDKEPPLSKMQELVGGYIEIISPNPKLQIIVNEEGLLMNLPINKEATLVWMNSGNYIEDAIIVGDAIILTKKGLIRG